MANITPFPRMYEYKVWYHAGYIHHSDGTREAVTGAQEFDNLTLAQEYFVECYNQLSQMDVGGASLKNGTAIVKMFHRGACIINTAMEAARL